MAAGAEAGHPMIPLPQLVAELALGLGVALAGANLWVVLRPKVSPSARGKPAPRPASMTMVFVNIVIGTIVAAWGLASLLNQP